MLTRLKMEWQLLRASRGYWAGLLFTLILTGLAFQVGWSRVQHQESLHQRFLKERNEILSVIQASITEKEKEPDTQTSERRGRGRVLSEPLSVDFDQLLNRSVSELEKQQYSRMWFSAKTPSGMAYLSSQFKVWKPPTVLGVISVGETDQWPEFYLPQLSSGGRQPVPSEAKTLAASRIVNPFHVSIGALDLTTLLIVIVPLVIIALNYDILSRDREQGILRLLAPQNLSLSSLIITRLMLRTLGLVGVIGLVTLISHFAVGADLSNRTTGKLLGMFLLAVTVYSLFWSSLVWLINSLGCSSTTNAVLLSILWLALVFVIPLSITQSAAKAYPVVPAGALAAKEKEIQKSIREMQAQQRLEAREMHGETTPASRTAEIARMQEQAQQGALKLQDAMKQEVERYYQQHQQREESLQKWQILSPVIAIKNLCDALSGNSQAQFVEFTKKVCDDHRNYLAHFQSLTGDQRRLTSADLEKMPFFPLDSSGPNLVWKPLWWSVASIACWGGLLSMLGWGLLQWRLKTI